VAAGSERIGFHITGPPCTNGTAWADNSAHSAVTGVWLRANTAGSSCTLLGPRFSMYLNWDFGLVTTKGIPSDLVLDRPVVADNKHAGISVLRLSGMTEPGEVGGLALALAPLHVWFDAYGWASWAEPTDVVLLPLLASCA
jgi:hypothetical protein